jgi:hypothetical protein
MISGFRRQVAENCALLDDCAAISGNFLPAFRDKFSVFQGFKIQLLNPEDGPIYKLNVQQICHSSGM